MHLELHPSASGELPSPVAGAVLVDERDADIDACYTERHGALHLVGRTVEEVLTDGEGHAAPQA